MAYNIKELQNLIPQTGKIDLISRRPSKKAPVEILETVEITTEAGIVGDHYQGSSKNRQVTLIQEEHLQSIGSILGKTVPANETRRNIVVSGINLLAFKDHQFQLGEEVILEMTGLCHPCSRMEENLGPGGYQAMRGHGGITARVVKGGRIRIGDTVKMISNNVQAE